MIGLLRLIEGSVLIRSVFERISHIGLLDDFGDLNYERALEGLLVARNKEEKLKKAESPISGIADLMLCIEPFPIRRNKGLQPCGLILISLPVQPFSHQQTKTRLFFSLSVERLASIHNLLAPSRMSIFPS